MQSSVAKLKNVGCEHKEYIGVVLEGQKQDGYSVDCDRKHVHRAGHAEMLVSWPRGVISRPC